MRYLKEYKSEKSITKEEIEDYFSHTFDFGQFEIQDAYFDPNNTKEWASNDFSNKKSKWHPDYCIKGFHIVRANGVYISTLEDFNKYAELINQMAEDANRFKKIAKPRDLFFDDVFTILIVP